MIFMLIWFSVLAKWECCGGGVDATYAGGLGLLRFSIGMASGCGGVDVACGDGSSGLGLLWFSTVVASRCGGGFDAPCVGGSGGFFVRGFSRESGVNEYKEQ
ncbi:Hypothetical predicted protein [Olea europaea subsp. europaea]|uniref:Secreted protein n=1 Tax=Olea europaea subsp. europaea TaxID=158383 RepID=A0A8S0PRV2_OLEEU|nr:Hypothetical predicted protein [Olea europaea subsp. europaea]